MSNLHTINLIFMFLMMSAYIIFFILRGNITNINYKPSTIFNRILSCRESIIDIQTFLNEEKIFDKNVDYTLSNIEDELDKFNKINVIELDNNKFKTYYKDDYNSAINKLLSIEKNIEHIKNHYKI